MTIGFDNQLYLKKQEENIRKRIDMFHNKLYLEFGGKLFDDLHAARVLPGYDPNVKTKLLLKFKDQAEIILCISARALDERKRRSDFGITYDVELIRLMDNLRSLGLTVSNVVITMFTGQQSAIELKEKLERRKEKVYIHKPTKGYPNDVSTIVSDEGYGANPYVETTRPLVVVSAPGPGSGKLATCLSQLYHEYKKGVKAGYAKFESFPVWNLPLAHPVNIAYEAATADLEDFNMIDSFHLNATGELAVNYNRDMQVFPVVRNILSRILGDDSAYPSPTCMGVNMIGYAITDQDVVENAAKQEVIRRYFSVLCDYKQGTAKQAAVDRVTMLMSNMGLSETDRAVVDPARKKSQERGVPACALQLPDGSIVRGRNGKALKATAAVVFNAMKKHFGVQQKLNLLSPIVIEPILQMKQEIYGMKETALTLSEALVALAVSAPTNTTIDEIVKGLDILRGCEAHSTVMLPQAEIQALRKLGINITCDPEYDQK